MPKKLSIWITTLTLAAALFLSTSVAAFAAPQHVSTHLSALSATCSGDTGPNGCTGKDPQTTGCTNDAYTANSAFIKDGWGNNIGIVELRYSPTCKTNWSRVSNYNGASELGAWVGYGSCLDDMQGLTHASYSAHSYSAVTIWTYMIYAPTQVAFATGNNGTPFSDACADA